MKVQTFFAFSCNEEECRSITLPFLVLTKIFGACNVYLPIILYMQIAAVCRVEDFTLESDTLQINIYILYIYIRKRVEDGKHPIANIDNKI